MWPISGGGSLDSLIHSEYFARMKTIQNFIDGKSVPAKDGKTSQIINPATGEAFATAPVSSAADVDAAYNAASKAFESWRDSTPSERQKAIFRIADAIESREIGRAHV